MATPVGIFESHIALTPGDISRLGLASAYDLHTLVYTLFDGEARAAAGGRIVYADQGGDATSQRILVRAPIAPDEAVVSRLGVAVQTSQATLPSQVTKKYIFNVVINPTVTDRQSNRRAVISSFEEIAKWFAHRANAHWGFAVDPQALLLAWQRSVSIPHKQGHQFSLVQAHLGGVLHVTDLTQFSLSWSQGIGKGKAFGCGLLQLRALI